MLALSMLFVTHGASAEQLSNQSEVDSAVKQLKDATQTATDNIPRSSVFKDLEDNLDKAARKNDDTPDKPASKKRKAQKAEDDAQAKADSFRGRTTAEQAKRAENYRDALRKRREARRRLKAALRQVLKESVNARQQGWTGVKSFLQGWMNKLRRFIKQSEQTITASTQVSALPTQSDQSTLSINGYAGQLKRPKFGSALQLESLGAIVVPRFAIVKRDDDYQAADINGAIPFGVGSVDRLIFGYHYGTATNHSYWGEMPTGGAGLNILSPQGPSGGLGGGVWVNGLGGFADVTNLRYADNYSEHLGYLGLKFKPWRFGNTGLSITPFAKMIGGYDRESSNYAGTSANGGLDFAYSNHIDTWRVGGELGAYAKQPLSDKFGLFGTGAVRFIYNYGSADSTLSLGGLVNATESANASVDKSDIGFVGGGGVYVKSGNATFSAGAEYETWQVPTLLYSPTAPVTLEYKPRDSTTFKFGMRLEF